MVSDSTDVLLLNLTVRGMGAGGIAVTNSNGTVVAGATVVGSGGVAVDTWGGGNRATLAPSGIAVVDSTVRHWAALPVLPGRYLRGQRGRRGGAQ